MSAAHLSATFSKELERAAYNELPKGIDRERLRHEVAICGAGGVVRNLIFVARLVLNRLTSGPKKAPTELAHLERCAAPVPPDITASDRVVEALVPSEVAA